VDFVPFEVPSRGRVLYLILSKTSSLLLRTLPVSVHVGVCACGVKD
jgi:hypothetical protein